MKDFTISQASNFLETGELRSRGNNANSVTSLTSKASVAGPTFQETLKDAINQVNNLQVQSDKAMQDLSTGRTDNVADVMITAEKADIALKLMMQVRNKIIDAYQEVMRMQV